MPVLLISSDLDELFDTEVWEREGGAIGNVV